MEINVEEVVEENSSDIEEEENEDFRNEDTFIKKMELKKFKVVKVNYYIFYYINFLNL